jgi:hypothetical protein
MEKVTDPNLIKQLDSPGTGGLEKVSDPALLDKLDSKYKSDIPFGEEATPNVSLGMRSGAAMFENFLANSAELIESVSSKISEATGLPTGKSATVAKEWLRKRAQEIGPDQEELQDHNSFGAKLVQSIATTPWAIAKYGLATWGAGGNPVAGMAIADAVQNEDKGTHKALNAALQGALMGSALKFVEPWGRAARAISMGGVGAGATALEGGDTSDILVNMLTMGGLALPGRGKTEAKKETKTETPPVSEPTKTPTPPGGAPKTVSGEPVTFKNEEGQTFQAVTIPGLKEFVEQDLAPATKSFLGGAWETGKWLVHSVAPKIGVPKESLDLIMKMAGEYNKAEYELERASLDIEKMFSKLMTGEQVAFIDSMKRGNPQPSTELQQIADFLRTVDTDTWNAANALKPSLAWMDNHFRVLWKVIPGSGAQGRGVGFRRPLEGSEGFFKQHTLDDMSQGIQAGGVPFTYNPITMFKGAFADIQKFITAQRMWNGLKDIGAVQFVKFGKKPPDGFVRVDDKITQVYFKVDEGLVKAGEYYVEEGAGRLLNRYLSRDYVRQAAVGRGLLMLKNMTTAAELGLSAFHFVFETIETAASGAGLGLRKMTWGVSHANMGHILEGAKDIITSPITPFTTAREGGSAIKFIDDARTFIASNRGQDFIQKYPDAAQLIDDLFLGGGKLAIHQDYKINTIRTFKEAIANHNYIGAAIRSIPALNELMMKPMFETYIPRLKVGMFLKEYSNALVERAGEIQRGEMTRPEVARRTWDFVEDRLGEMNFDNLFWDRTFKSSMQVLVRSVTWKLGNIRGFGKAFVEQAKEFKDSYDQGRLPTLAPEMGWALGVVSIHAVLGAMIQKMSTGKGPEELIDYFYPKIDEEGNRISIATYARDAFHLTHEPAGWVKSSMSGFISRMIDIWKNKDFFGVQVYDPEETYAQNTVDALIHMTPLPFSVTSYQKMKEKAEPMEKKALGFLGFTKAPFYIEQTAAQQKAYELMGEMMPTKPRTKEEFEKSKLIKIMAEEFNTASKKGDQAAQQAVLDKFTEGAMKGALNESDINRLVRRIGGEPLPQTFKRLDVMDSMKVWNLTNDKEKGLLAQPMADKIFSYADKHPQEFQKYSARFEKILTKIEQLAKRR